MKTIRQYIHWPLILFIALVFIQSLFFKFADSPETRYIFESKLEPWAASLGYPGLFSQGGIFSAPVIGTVELIASLLLLISLIKPHRPWLRILGAVLGLTIISGAIFFHLFTPLGIMLQNADGTSDNGELFTLACAVWLSCMILLYTNRMTIYAFACHRFQKK